MNHHKIAGGGVQLHVVEAGNPKGRAVLFIHGISQCSLAWSRQLSSDLADDHRLVAMDMRGHGLSDKPREGYDNSRLWADDVNATRPLSPTRRFNLFPTHAPFWEETFDFQQKTFVVTDVQ